MATQRYSPSGNPYGSAVVLDSTPYTQYFLNRQAQERAKEEALDNYFRDLDSKINTKGMYSEDIPGLIKQQNENKLFYLKNREAIKRPELDNGKALLEYQTRIRQTQGWVDTSIERMKDIRDFAKIAADPTKRRLMNKSMFAPDGAIALNALGMDDPRFKRLKLTDIDFNPPPFDINKYANTFKAPESLNTTYETIADIDPKNPQFKKREIVTATPIYDNLKLAAAGESAYENDPSLVGFVDKISSNQSLYEKYNNIYKKTFGKELDIQHPEQIAAALFLEQKKNPYQKSAKEIIDTIALGKYNYERAEKDRRDRQRISISHADARAGLGTDNIGDYEQNSRTGTLFKRSPETPSAADVEIIRFPETVTKELSDVIGGEIENVGRMPDGRYFDIKLRKDDTIDWLKSKEIPYLQIRSAIANKALPSTFKVKQVTGKPKKTEPNKDPLGLGL